MTISLSELTSYLEILLDVQKFQDYCPNGLQVEGRQSIKRIVTGVTASQALIDQAIAVGADAILVHHGYFWKGEPAPITGIKAKRIKALMQHDISLLAYHLPLDAHGEFGNNAQLAKLLGLEICGGLDGSDVPIGFWGKPSKPCSLEAFAQNIEQQLLRKPLVIGAGNKQLSKVAWCTGAAQSYIEKAVALGVDCFISGEISEPTVHIARECDIAYISAGHHATERYGVKALGEHLQQKFAIECQFIDIDNPV